MPAIVLYLPGLWHGGILDLIHDPVSDCVARQEHHQLEPGSSPCCQNTSHFSYLLAFIVVAFPYLPDRTSIEVLS